jgi:hypothetical protein
MATQVQFRRGTTTQNNAFTGANGEVSVDTDVKTIRLHDGLTAGGVSTLLNTTSAQTVLNKTHSTGSVWNGSPVPLLYGGTGTAITAAAGAIAYSGATGLALTSAGTAGQILVSGGTGAPSFVNASTVTAGTATNAVTATNIAGGSAGQLVIQADTNLSTFITAGATGTFLKSAGAGYAPEWATADITIGTTVIDLGSSSTSLAGLNILAASGTSHWTLPAGTTLQRPGTPAVGMVRYNSDQVSFEGYSSGAWSSLGGVSSVDKYTYIRAETSAGASNGELEFFAKNAAGNAAEKVMGITKDGVIVAGNLTVNGTTTTINSTTVSVDDKNIELGSVTTPTNTTANGGGITLKGATDKTIIYASSDESWNMNINLNVTGTIAATGDITSPNFYSVSDERFKSNIQDSPYGLAEVMKLRPVEYDIDGRHEVGLLAQNVEANMPEFVTTDANGIKKLDYAKMVSVLVKTVQEQQAQIEELKVKLG